MNEIGKEKGGKSGGKGREVERGEKQLICAKRNNLSVQGQTIVKHPSDYCV